jgi:hypothetical protein
MKAASLEPTMHRFLAFATSAAILVVAIAIPASAQTRGRPQKGPAIVVTSTSRRGTLRKTVVPRSMIPAGANEVNVGGERHLLKPRLDVLHIQHIKPRFSGRRTKLRFEWRGTGYSDLGTVKLKAHETEAR